MIYWVSYFDGKHFITVLETEDLQDAMNVKERLEKEGKDVILDYDN